MSGGAYRPHLPVRRPGGRPEQAPRYRVLVHRQFKHLWEALPDRVGLQSAQQFYEHVAHAPGSPAAINRTGVFRGKAGRPISEGFSRTITEKIILRQAGIGRTPAVSGYAVIIEGDEAGGFSAWSPDLLGCVAAAATYEGCVALMREAVAGHLEVMREHGDLIPVPSAINRRTAHRCPETPP